MAEAKMSKLVYAKELGLDPIDSREAFIPF